MRRSSFLIGMIGAVFAASCGGGGGGGYTTSPTSPTGTTGTPSQPSNPATKNEITLSESSFEPPNVSVPKGTTVTWTWHSCTDSGSGYGYGTCVSHSVTFDDGTYSPTQSEGTFTRVFDVVGTFKYHCSVHPSTMSGQVTVQ